MEIITDEYAYENNGSLNYYKQKKINLCSEKKII